MNNGRNILTADFFKRDIYDYFYDQAHFIKEFKRFTGLSPLKFVKSENEFGRFSTRNNTSDFYNLFAYPHFTFVSSI